MTQPAGELLVIDKAYELVLWSCRHVANFPRSHRFTLGERMERRLYDLLELLRRAEAPEGRSARLSDPYLSPAGMSSKPSPPQSGG